MKKLITVAVPVYNELLNIQPLYMRTSAVCETLSAYDYEIVFFDDGSTDGTRKEIEALCAADTHVKAVFYSRNFGYSKNIFYAMQQAKGDCAIILHADLQNPPELIPAFIEKWETGAQIVQGVKTKSKENGLMFFLRTVYYWLLLSQTAEILFLSFVYDMLDTGLERGESEIQHKSNTKVQHLQIGKALRLENIVI